MSSQVIAELEREVKQYLDDATRLRELLREVMEAYHEGIESPLEFNEWLRAMDKVYGWELSKELADE